MNCVECGNDFKLDRDGKACGQYSYVTKDGTGEEIELQPDHLGQCCDCFNERWGMPAGMRSKPRKATNG